MSKRLSLGYSTAAAMSHSEIGWKERLRKIGLLLLLAALLALFFLYLTHSVDRKITASNSTEVGWDAGTAP
jgi:hypothetical protein